MSTIKIRQSSLINLLVFIILFCLPNVIGAQSDLQKSEDADKAETSIKLVYSEANNLSKILAATITTTIDDTDIGVKGVHVYFYQNGIGFSQLLGTAVSNGKGVAVLIVPEKKLSQVSNEYTFIAAIKNDKKFADDQEQVIVSEADFNMTLQDEDDLKQVLISLKAPDASGKLVPLAEVDVNLYVQRLFGLLPFPDNPETTDENGEITVDFPSDIPGDTAGNLVIVARVEEHEMYGNLEFHRKMNWGAPLVIDHRKHARELWSSRANAPLYLIFFINTVLICIWGVIAYIIYEVFQIKKLGRQSVG